MKNNKTYLLSIMLLLVAAVAGAQQKSYKGKLHVVPYEFSQRGDSLYVGMNLDIAGLKIDSRRALDLIPVIKTTHGKQRELPSIKICGRNRYKAYKRAVALSGEEYETPYAVVRSRRFTPVNYSYAIPFEKWMKDARLDLIEDLCGCAGATQQISVEPLVANVSLEKMIIKEVYEIAPHIAYVRPEVEAVKERALAGEAHLNFHAGKSVILPDFGNNPAELKKIRELIESVKDDRDVSVRQIEIMGYASPEGSLESNRKLSEARAAALKDYLTQWYGLPESLYRINFGGEDWEGLVSQVETSDMSYKLEVLDIIRNIPVTSGREKRLMDFKGGEPYRYMLREMFPSLRKAVVTVNYRVKAFSLEEARKIILTRPQDLSLEEMYRVANSYSPDSGEFRDVFETAVRLYPDDYIANLNAAANALSHKDTATAQKYLGKMERKIRMPEYENCMGVLLMLKGDYAGAENWLKQAESAGIKEASMNLEELVKKRENEVVLKQTVK